MTKFTTTQKATMTTDGTTLTPTTDAPHQLGLDLSAARHQLTQARLAQLRKDCPGNRKAVDEARALVDALLDFYFALGAVTP